ncbi:MAG: hypothetical protein R2737_15740 [Candidatus Nanopelagicales bacterium]
MTRPARHPVPWLPVPRLLAFLFAPLLALTLVGAAPSTSAVAAQPTVKGAAYAHLKTFLTQYDSTGFAHATKIAGLVTFRRTLASVRVKVDRALKPIALYDPKSHTITFSRDPRTLPLRLVLDFGETVWHELVHAIEDDHGDIGVLDSTNYAERNVEYMAQVVNVAFPKLRNMERLARKGASTATLARYWKLFLGSMSAAAQDAVKNGYPVKPALLSSWFGFSANTDKIKAYYLSGKFLPGRPGNNLRAAIRGDTAPPPPTAPSWAGTWTTNWGTMTLTQSGATVTGTYTSDGRLTGTVSGNTLTGRWSDGPNWGPADGGTFVFTRTSTTGFMGSWKHDDGQRSGTWTGRLQ